MSQEKEAAGPASPATPTESKSLSRAFAAHFNELQARSRVRVAIAFMARWGWSA